MGIQVDCSISAPWRVFSHGQQWQSKDNFTPRKKPTPASSLRNQAVRDVRKRCSSLLYSATPVLEAGSLIVNGNKILNEVPRSVKFISLTDTCGFLGSSFIASSSRHVFKLGLIREATFMCLFRFKVWWMIPRFGKSGSDIPVETQMMLMETKGPKDCSVYVVLLPVLEGDFRSSLQGTASNHVEVCVESGDDHTVTSQCEQAVFLNCGTHPYDLMKESMKILQDRVGTFKVREEKQLPKMLDVFGWCTWDAFYHDVSPEGIDDGLRSLAEGGTPAQFLIIDDGWQNTRNEFQIKGEPIVEGSQFGARLASISENKKFRGLGEFVRSIKQKYGVRYVYVWHALMGYWGGLDPDAPGTVKYNAKMTSSSQSPGNLANMRDLAMDCMEKYRIGVIDKTRISQFYDDLHTYLGSQGIDGVKVDVQNILETIANKQGGRVSLTRVYQNALENSVAANFSDNGIICCMGQSTDSIYHSKRSAVTRASDDYYPRNPKTQSLHVASVSFNSIFLGEVVVPDWDMFYSQHETAEFHAMSRAVGGCGVYVSDVPGEHDFDLLRKLVLPDGTILRARYPGRPTRDCLFVDPVMDGKSLLKIWNLNALGGVIGVFNCQGAGTWPCLHPSPHAQFSGTLQGAVSPLDVEYLDHVSRDSSTAFCAVFSYRNRHLRRVGIAEHLFVELGLLQSDIFTVSPIQEYHAGIEFAPIGLINMYNSGGAVEDMKHCKDSTGLKITIRGRGGGTFAAYSNCKPFSCYLNMELEPFVLRDEDNLLTIKIPPTTINWAIDVCYLLQSVSTI